MREKVYPLLFHLFAFVLFGMQANTHPQTADSINPDLDSTIIISRQGTLRFNEKGNWDCGGERLTCRVDAGPCGRNPAG